MRVAVGARTRVSIAGSASVDAWASCNGGSLRIFAGCVAGGGESLAGGPLGGGC